MTRPGWQDYFLAIAAAVSLRADCRRRRVGALVVRDNRIMSTGYNGSYPGGPSCLNGQCPRGLLSYQDQPANSPYNNCHAVHAEANALLYASMDQRRGATVYVTDSPCPECLKLLRASGILEVIWPTGRLDLP